MEGSPGEDGATPASGSDQGDEGSKEKPNTSRKQRMAYAFTKVNQIVWPLGNMLWKDDKSHVEAGLFAVETISANCWAGCTDYASCWAADALCMQETLVPGGQTCVEAEQDLSSSKWKTAFHACFCTGGGGTAAGVGIVVRSHMG